MAPHAHDYHAVLRDLPEDLRQLAEAIKTIQTRIGTPTELPGDLLLIQKTTHKYVNYLTEYFVARDLAAPAFATAYQKSHTQQ